MASPPLKEHRDLPADKFPYSPTTGPKLKVDEKMVETEPEEVLLGGKTAQDPPAVCVLETDDFSGAVYTCRGPTQERQGLEYKSFNEDAAYLRLSGGAQAV